MSDKKCSLCKEVKSLDCFDPNRAHKDGKQNYCKPCRKIYNKKYCKESPKAKKRLRFNIAKRRARGTILLRKYCEFNPCVVCGEKDFDVLEFDHIGEKTKGISRMVLDGAKFEDIKKELDKCQVLCANCHRRKTVKQLGYYNYFNELSPTVLIELEKKADEEMKKWRL